MANEQLTRRQRKWLAREQVSEPEPEPEPITEDVEDEEFYLEDMSKAELVEYAADVYDEEFPMSWTKDKMLDRIDELENDNK